MKRLLQLEDLLKIDNDRYIGETNYVLIKGKEHQFIKGYVGWPPFRFGHSKIKMFDPRRHNVLTPSTYIIQAQSTGEVYVGSTGSTYKRICLHRSDIKRKKHGNPGLNRIIQESTIDDFVIIAIFTNTREEAYELEQHLTDLYRPTGTLLNKGTDVKAPLKGEALSAESKEKISIARKTDPALIAQTREVHNRKKLPVSVDGVVYESLTEASNKSKYSNSFLRRRLRNGDNPNIFWTTDKRNVLVGTKISEEHKKILSMRHKSDPTMIAQLESIRHLCRKKIMLNGVLYDSVLEASRKTGLGESTIHKKLKSVGSKNNEIYTLNYIRPNTSKPLYIDGIIYTSIRDAARKTNIKRDVIKNRLRKGMYKVPSVKHYKV